MRSVLERGGNRRNSRFGCAIWIVAMSTFAAALPGCDKMKQDGPIPSSTYRGGPLDAVMPVDPPEGASAAASSPKSPSAPAPKK